jgi:elongation factor 1-alpha
MDDTIPPYSKERYDEMKAEISRMLAMVGFKVQVKDADGKMVEKIRFIPVSGWTGENLVKKSTNMPWYTGPTLIEALDLLEIPAKPTNKPLRMPVQDVYSITGIGTVPVGRVETGTVKPGDSLFSCLATK